MTRVVFSPEAYNDLLELSSELRQRFGDATSKHVTKRIMSSIEKLNDFPEAGFDVMKKHGITCNYRCLITAKNYVFYRIDEDTVLIIRIIDQRQDFIKVLFGADMFASDEKEYWDNI